MKRIRRRPLSDHATQYLRGLQAEVDGASDPAAAATALWANRKANRAFDEIRETLKTKMAAGCERCMFCGDSAGTDIEHFRPKSTFPGHAFRWENYLLACSTCNGPTYKGTKFPQDPAGNPLLLDPTTDRPAAHLPFEPLTGLFEEDAATDKGRETIRTVGLNRAMLQRARVRTWNGIGRIVVGDLWEALEAGAQEAIDKLFHELAAQSSPEIVRYFLEDALRPEPAFIAPRDVAKTRSVLERTLYRWRRLL